MTTEKTIVNGSRLARAFTINSMYADGKIGLKDDQGTEYRIDVSEILTLLKQRTFTATPKRKYQHLTLNTSTAEQEAKREKSISVPLGQSDLEEMLHEGKEFHWNFKGVDVHLYPEDL